MSADRAVAKAHAPGKLILSGEHSVLYGAPALAVALARYTEVWFKPLSPGQGLRTTFVNLSDGVTYSLSVLSKIKTTLDRRFDQFARGDLKVHEVLTRPEDLAVYTLASLLHDRPPNRGAIPGFGAVGQLPAPGELGSRSDVPIGAGMGSSAAIVAATTILFEGLLETFKSPDERFARVRFCERLRHGTPGPIDAASVVYGGLLRVEGTDGLPQRLALETDHSLMTGDGWFWVLHGRPLSGTGECVSAVAERYGKDRDLWESFAACTRAFEKCLLDDADPRSAITENQRLLERIGVVPQAAQDLIAQVETEGGAAKICGAGAVCGDHGGAILVRLPDPGAMAALMAEHPDLSWGPLKVSAAGAAPGPAPATAQAVQDG